MRILLTLILILGSSGWLFSAEKVDQAVEKFANWSGLKTASVGVCVIPLEEEKAVATWQPDLGLIPASTMKAVTTATAIQVLGPEHRFKTRLFLEGKNLVIKGGGDPTLATTNLEVEFPAWLEAIKEAGLMEIEGDLVGDPSYFENERTPNDWPWGDVGNYYGAGPSGLNFHLNLFRLTFDPGKAGKPARLVSAIPKPPGVTIKNEMMTGSSGSGDQGWVYGGPETDELVLRGTVPAGGNFTIKGALPDPPLMCISAFRDYLKGKDVKITGKLRVAKVDCSKAKEIFVQESPTMEKIIKGTNYRSVNLYADSIFKELGGKGTTAAAVSKVKKIWKDAGVDLTGFVMLDGSGLSPRNTVTARQLAMILKKARAHETGERFKKSLPVAGKSGSLKSLGRGTQISGRVHAKSGGMTRVKTYTGYFTADSGKEYSFAIMTNNFIRNPKSQIVDLLSAMLKNL